MSGGRSAECADALKAQGYSLRGFSPGFGADVDGRRVLVTASIVQNLVAFVGHRSFRVMSLDAARQQYPEVFV